MPRQWNISRLAPNSRNYLELDFDVKIPFTVLRGGSESPRVAILAGVHGDEYEGVAALQRLETELDLRELKGSVIIAPVVNPQAFAAGLRRNPVDDGDLNRSFPGAPDGSVSMRLARVILDEFIDGTTAMLSLHGWSKEAMVLPYGEYPIEDSDLGRKSKECAGHLGFEYLHPYLWPAGVLGNSALAMGVAAVETEIGGQGTITAEGQALSRQIILRFLDFFGVLPWKELPIKLAALEIEHADLFAECAGLFEATIKIGDSVAAGSQLGAIRDLRGGIVQELKAPIPGLVAILRTFASVQPGDRLVQLFFTKVAV
jgi:N-alpha-acetyl-L-2,4-diaminobutyrate deacetylase